MEKKIKEIIQSRKKRSTQRSIAKELGISEQYLSHIITGRRKCPERLIKKINKIIK